MSEVSFYDITILVFTKRIQQLKHCLEQGEQWCKENNKDKAALVHACIHEDMRPLPFQVQTCYRMLIYFFMHMGLEGAPDPTKVPVVDSYDAMIQQTDEMQKLVGTVTPEMLKGKASKEVKFGPPGRDPWDLTGMSFVQDFIMPNLYFHSTTAYNILRKEGVPVGKLDYLGKVGA